MKVLLYKTYRTMNRHWPTQPKTILTLLLIVVTASLTASISCYDCEYSLKLGTNFDFAEAKPCFLLNTIKTNTTRECQAHEKSCFVYQIKRNGIIIHYRRNCKYDCEVGCTYEGFGYMDAKCSFCCDKDGCNGWPAGTDPNARCNLRPTPNLTTVMLILCIYVIGISS